MERKWWTLVVVCVSIFMLLLDITVVNVALPVIQKELHASFSDIQWVIDAYALTLASLLLTAGTLGDMLGRRKVFAAGMVLFCGASLACGLSKDPLALEISRALREQVDWNEVRRRTEHSPFARAFLNLVVDLGIAGAENAPPAKAMAGGT